MRYQSRRGPGCRRTSEAYRSGCSKTEVRPGSCAGRGLPASSLIWRTPAQRAHSRDRPGRLHVRLVALLPWVFFPAGRRFVSAFRFARRRKESCGRGGRRPGTSAALGGRSGRGGGYAWGPAEQDTFCAGPAGEHDRSEHAAAFPAVPGVRRTRSRRHHHASEISRRSDAVSQQK